MTIIKSKESGRTVEVLLDNETGEDMMPDILGGCGICPSADDDADWEVDYDYELSWWVSWAETQQLILAARDASSVEAIAADDDLINTLGSDLGVLQDAECELFGIER